MENYTQIRVELDVAAQKLISQYMINNERIEKDIEAGIKRAFETINLEKEVERSVKNAIERAIKDSSEWGKIRDAVKKRKRMKLSKLILRNQSQNLDRTFKLSRFLNAP